MKLIASWSGGKDCCLAAHKTLQAGHRIEALLNLMSEESGRCCFHGLPNALLADQARALGIPISQKSVPADMSTYEDGFKAAVRALKREHGIAGMVFGDIYLDEHKDWVERVCGELRITALEPLWNRPPRDVANEFLEAGFTAVVVSCKADLMGEEFVGRVIDARFLDEMASGEICPCGENGEFHTLVVDGPLFKRRIALTRTKPVLIKGFWQHWALDIQAWELQAK